MPISGTTADAATADSVTDTMTSGQFEIRLSTAAFEVWRDVHSQIRCHVAKFTTHSCLAYLLVIILVGCL